MSVDVLLRSLYVEDKMVEEQNEFSHLVTSKLEEGEAKDLVRIRYQGVQKASPEFMTVYEGIDKVSCARACVYVRVCVRARVCTCVCVLT